MKRRFLAILLAAVMCIGVFPAVAFADPGNLDPGEFEMRKIIADITGPGSVQALSAYNGYGPVTQTLPNDRIRVVCTPAVMTNHEGEMYSPIFESVEVIDAFGNQVQLDSQDYFTMPDCDVTIKAVFTDQQKYFKLNHDNDVYGGITTTVGGTVVSEAREGQWVFVDILVVQDPEDYENPNMTNLREVREIYVLDSDGRPLHLEYLTEDKEHAYFVMPYSEVTITSVVRRPNEPDKMFDVNTDAPLPAVLVTNAESAAYGQMITFSYNDVFRGSEGDEEVIYDFVSVAVTDQYGNDVPLVGNSFSMPHADVTIKAVYDRRGTFDKTYRVTLDPGQGGGSPVVYEASFGVISQYAQNGQFYYYDRDPQTAFFRLDPDYCPPSFSAPGAYYVFDGWNAEVPYPLTESEYTFTAKWRRVEAEYSISPMSASLTGPGLTVVPITADTLVYGHIDDSDEIPAFLEISVRDHGFDSSSCVLSNGSKQIRLRLGQTGNNGMLILNFYNEKDVRDLKLYIDPADYASAEPGAYTGVIKCHAIWYKGTSMLRIDDLDLNVALVIDTSIGGIPAASGRTYSIAGGSWRVIGENSDKYLMIAANGMGGTMAWTSADTFVNNYYANNFSAEEKNAVIPVSKSSAAYDNYAAAPLTNARLFQLSAGEAKYYFSSDADRAPGMWWLRNGSVSGSNVAYAVHDVPADAQTSMIRAASASASNAFSVRPAFQFNKSAILFTSRQWSKAMVDDGLIAFDAPSDTDTLEITLHDSSRDGFSAAVGSPAERGGNITINYSGAKTGTNECVSVMFCDLDGNVLYYASTPAADTGSGTWTLALPTEINNGKYKLKVFSEQRNSNNCDVAGGMTELPLTVSPSCVISVSADPSEGGSVTGGGVYAVNSTVTVTAAAEDTWHFIGWSENGKTVSTEASYSFIASADRDLKANISPSSCTVTITSNNYTMGQSHQDGQNQYAFGSEAVIDAYTKADHFGFVAWTDENGAVVSTESEYRFTVTRNITLTAVFAYATGQIGDMFHVSGGSVFVGGARWRVIGESEDKWLVLADGLSSGKMGWENAKSYCGTVFDAFSAPEKAIVSSTTKTDASYKHNNTVYTAADLSDAKLFLMSVAEVMFYTGTSAERTPGPWWLRSATANGGIGYVNDGGNTGSIVATSTSVYARPAFVIDKSAVLLRSAAEGGKPAPGSGLAAYVAPAAGTDSKLTLVDSSITSFSAAVSGTSIALGESVSINYSGVPAGDLVSAMLCSRDGTPVSYASIEADQSGSGTWVLETAGKAAAGAYTLKVFSERRNSGIATDTASTVSEFQLTILAPSFPITLKPGTGRITAQVGGTQQSSAMAGESVSLYVQSPMSPGTTFDLTLTVITDNGADVSFTKGEGNVYTFTMPPAGVIAAAVFTPKYGISLPSVSGLELEVSPSSAAENEPVAVTVKSMDSGVTLNGINISVQPANLGDDARVFAADKADDTHYTFRMPASPVIIVPDCEREGQYTITDNTGLAAGNVQITVAGVAASSADEGDTVSVSITPPDGYDAGLIVTAADSQPVTVSNGPMGSSFTMPAQGVTISVDLKPGIMLSSEINSPLDPNSHGSVSVTVGGSNVYSASPAETVTITAYPAEGYAFGNASAVWYDLLNEEHSLELTRDAQDQNVYTFVMPERPVYVSGRFNGSVILSASGLLEDGSSAGVDISTDAGAAIYEGDRITVTAAAKEGYTFLGWYSASNEAPYYSGSVLCDALAYTFEIAQNTAVAAVYRARGSASVNISVVNNAKYTVGESSTVQSGGTENVPLGTVLTLTAADGQSFLHWQNESGNIMGRSTQLSVKVTGNMNITLVYKGETGAGSSFVQFVSDYGQILAAKTYGAGESISFPDHPTKLGGTFDSWVFEGTDSIASQEAIQARIGTESTIIVKPSYITDQASYTVAVAYNGVLRDPDIYSGRQLGSGFAVSAPDIDGFRFSCWKQGSTVLSYRQDYYIRITGTVVLTAVYVPDSQTVSALPVINIGQLGTAAEGSVHKVTAIATRSIPDGYTLSEHGMLYAKDFNDPTADNFVTGGAGVSRYISNTTMMNGTVKLNVKVDSDSTVVTMRGYMILVDNSTGNEVTFYSELLSGSYSGLAH